MKYFALSLLVTLASASPGLCISVVYSTSTFDIVEISDSDLSRFSDDSAYGIKNILTDIPAHNYLSELTFDNNSETVKLKSQPKIDALEKERAKNLKIIELIELQKNYAAAQIVAEQTTGELRDSMDQSTATIKAKIDDLMIQP